MQQNNRQEKQIERANGDKLKGFTLQKQRALSLFFDAYKMNPRVWVSCAVEYEGDVYCSFGDVQYIEEQKNYDPSTGFSFNSYQVLNTLVYFLHFWLKKADRSPECRFGFYSTNSIAKEKTTKIITIYGLTLPDKPILQLFVEGQFRYAHLIPVVRKLLCVEYNRQYGVDIEANFTEDVVLDFLHTISFYTDQKDEKQLKKEIIEKIEDCEFVKFLNDRQQAPLVYALLMEELEERQNEEDVLFKFIQADLVENAYLKLNSREYKAEESGVVLQTFFPVPDYIPRTVSLTEVDTNLLQMYLHPEQYPFVSLKDCITGKVAALKDQTKFILYSSSQWGKSTELEQLAWQLQVEGFTVFLYKIKNYTSQIRVSDFLLYKATSRPVVILIDGIDEINDDGRSDLFKELENFAQRHTGLYIILSCRSNFRTEGFLNSYYPVYLNELSWPDAKTYIKRKIKNASSFIRRIEKDGLTGFTTIPFYLETLIDYFKEKNTLPSEKFQLYDYWIKKSFQIDDSKCRSELNEIEMEGEDLLRKMAVVLQLTEKNYLTEKELLEVLKDKNKIQLCRRFSVLKRDNNNHYFFEHNAFKEYFVATFLLEKSYDKILSLICYHGENKVKPLWYNVIVLLLSHLTPGSRLATQIINWLTEYNKELLLHVDPGMLDVSCRSLLFKEILLFYKEKDIRYSHNLYEYKNLISFGFSVDSIRFVVEELQAVSSLSPYVVNLYEIGLNLDYGMVSLLDSKLLEELEGAIYTKIEVFKNNPEENGFEFYIYLPFENRHFHTSKHVQQLYNVIKDCNHHNAIKAFLKLIVKTGLTDNYIAYLLEKEKYVGNYHMDGVTHMVSRGSVFKAFENIRECNNLLTAFPLLDSLQDESIREKNNILRLKEYFLQQLQSYATGNKEVLAVVEACYLQECGKHYSYPPDYRFKNYQLYKQFYIKLFPQREPLIPHIKKLKECFLKDECSIGEIERINLIIAFFINKETVDDLLEKIDIHSETDYAFMNWLVNPLEKDLNEYTKNRVTDLFPHFRKQYPDFKLREQNELELLFDYDAFKKEIIRVVEEKQPVSRKDFTWRFSEKEEDKMNPFIFRFFVRFYKEDQYDLESIRKYIENICYYEAFLLCMVSDFIQPDKISSLTSGQEQKVIALVKKEIDLVLKRKTVFKQSLAAFNLLLYWEIPLEEEKLIGLLSYGDYECSCKRNQDEGWNRLVLFDWIKREVNPDCVTESILKLMNQHRETPLTRELFRIFSKYIVKSQIEEGYNYILQEIKNTNDDFNQQANLMYLFLELEEGKDLIKLIFPSFSLDAKLFFIKRIIAKYPEEYSWIEYQLVPAYREYPEEAYREALRILIHIGNMEALGLCKDILSENPHYFGSSDPVFVYTTQEAIPDLCEILSVVLSAKYRTEHMDNNILHALETIAVQSRENLDKVVKGLEKLITEKNLKSLNYSIRDFTDKFYETVNQTLRVTEAMTIYELL